MQKRFLVVALALLGLLVLVSFWQANEPPARVKPLKPSELPLDGEPLAGSRPLEARLQDKPLDSSITELPRELPPPPPAPVVENDPAKGRIWLRLIDTRSNRPVADTFIELHPAGYTGAGTGFSYLQERQRPSPRPTDKHGLIALSICRQDALPDEPVEVILNTEMEEATLLHVPIPKGWYPIVDPYDLGCSMHRIGANPSTRPLDVLVTPFASVNITARDEWGVPLPDAQIENVWIYAGSAADEWLSMQENTHDTIEESQWTGWTEEERREFTRESVTTSFAHLPNGRPRIVYYEEPAYGSILLRNLPCVKFGAVGWHPVYGFAAATLQLVPGSNELNLYLRPEGSATLNVRIEWVGELPGGDNGPQLELISSGPCGLNERLEDTDNAHEFYWELANSTTGVWTGTIRNVPAGWWTLTCSFPGNADGSIVRFQVSPFEARGITLYGGDDIRARWKPIIRCGGVQLERASLRLLGGWEREPGQYSVDHDPETGETEALELTPGNYTVWIPTLPPVEITLKPNEERSDVYELAINTVRITIDAQLAGLLSSEGEPILLNLLPDDAWDGAEEHLYALDAAMRQRDENYDQLQPGVTRSWLIPAGSYRWELLGTDHELYGPIEFGRAGPTRLDFALNALPGLELLQLEFEGFHDEQPAVDFDDDGLQQTAIYAFGADDDIEFTRDYGGYIEEDRDVQRIWAAERMLYAFAPRGRRLVSVYAGSESADVHVDFPGRATVTPTQMVRPGEGLLRLRDAGDEEAEVYDPDFYHVMAYHERGECGDYTAGDFIEMELGRVQLLVSRSSGDSYSFARVTVTLTREEQELRLDKLDYKPFGRVTLTFSGRGSPDSPFDAWWYGENAPRPPVVLALDQVVAATPRYVHLGSPDQLLPQGRLEFVYKDRQLPPGRYKVIPWPGAEEKWHQTFEVKPAATTQATIQGGK
ncbi:MAG: hypothetical protein ICCCNLDF_02294 [Planctomycetes bacterium]|nr:hypothetical protein [Planctomycetota bacterium]